ncbi:MAG: 50S ribosomal protein L9 [Candidatus Niyogibacteria bacterium]|nr:50S ribosomal protein L9 [Candidatus Niyogibacteria bacterium]
MEVILLQDVPNIGLKDDVKNVKDGFARNFLFPKGIAELATPQALKAHWERKTQAAAARNEEEMLLRMAFLELKDAPIEIRAKTTEKGGLFKKIGKKEIIDAVAKAGFSALNENDIVLKESIKTAGEHAITIQRGDISTTIKVNIVKDEA